MSHKEKIRDLLLQCRKEVLTYIREREPVYPGRWVPATDVNEGPSINFSAVPKGSKEPAGQRGWLLAVFARMLEEEGTLEREKRGNRAYYRSVHL